MDATTSSFLTFYVAPNLSDDERDDLSTVGAMVDADFPDDYRTHDEFITVDEPRPPLMTKRTWVLLQRGFLTVER